MIIPHIFIHKQSQILSQTKSLKSRLDKNCIKLHRYMLIPLKRQNTNRPRLHSYFKLLSELRV